MSKSSQTSNKVIKMTTNIMMAAGLLLVIAFLMKQFATDSSVLYITSWMLVVAIGCLAIAFIYSYLKGYTFSRSMYFTKLQKGDTVNRVVHIALTAVIVLVFLYFAKQLLLSY